MTENDKNDVTEDVTVIEEKNLALLHKIDEEMQKQTANERMRWIQATNRTINQCWLQVNDCNQLLASSPVLDVAQQHTQAVDYKAYLENIASESRR